MIDIPTGAPCSLLSDHFFGLLMDLPSFNRSCGEIGGGEGHLLRVSRAGSYIALFQAGTVF